MSSTSWRKTTIGYRRTYEETSGPREPRANPADGKERRARRRRSGRWHIGGRRSRRVAGAQVGAKQDPVDDEEEELQRTRDAEELRHPPRHHPFQPAHNCAARAQERFADHDQDGRDGGGAGRPRAAAPTPRAACP
jgi:hypothetical protein